jgi:hypothetical protein
MMRLPNVVATLPTVGGLALDVLLSRFTADTTSPVYSRKISLVCERFCNPSLDDRSKPGLVPGKILLRAAVELRRLNHLTLPLRLTCHPVMFHVRDLTV